MAILHRIFYNNGYGCSCCRQDDEITEWIDIEEMIPVKELFTSKIKDFVHNIYNNGGTVGVQYEKDGEILYGIEPTIGKVNHFFTIRFGNMEFNNIDEDKPEVIDEILTAINNIDKDTLYEMLSNKNEISTKNDIVYEWWKGSIIR